MRLEIYNYDEKIKQENFNLAIKQKINGKWELIHLENGKEIKVTKMLVKSEDNKYLLKISTGEKSSEFNIYISDDSSSPEEILKSLNQANSCFEEFDIELIPVSFSYLLLRCNKNPFVLCDKDYDDDEED